MENKPSHAKQALPSEQAATKAAILAECERLAEAGITFVAVHFDGSGDEGANEEIKCYATEDYAYEESEAQETNFSCLQEHFEELDPYGYEQRMWRLRRRDLEREDPQDHGRKKRSLRRLTQPRVTRFNMAHPLKHAKSSAGSFGGKAEDYLRIHSLV
jgi:hypothetical protein